MKNRQTYSYALLYSVAPENFSTLHLYDEDINSGFGRRIYTAEFECDSYAQVTLNLLKKYVEWGIGVIAPRRWHRGFSAGLTHAQFSKQAHLPPCSTQSAVALP